MIAVMRPFGEVVISPFEVQHTASELSELAKLLKSLDGETRVVMESTGNYHNVVRIIIVWSEWRDLNSRPLDPQSSALPTAPHPDTSSLKLAY